MSDAYKGKLVHVCNGKAGDRNENAWLLMHVIADGKEISAVLDGSETPQGGHITGNKFLAYPYLDEENTYFICSEHGYLVGYSADSSLLTYARWGNEKVRDFAFVLDNGVMRPRDNQNLALNVEIKDLVSDIGNPWGLLCFKGESAFNDMQFVLADHDDLPLPAVEESGDVSASAPELESHEPPVSLEHHAVRVTHIPCFMVDDPDLDLYVRPTKSPYYSIERRVRLITKEEWFIFNDSSADQKRTWTTTVGWSETNAHDFTSTVGVSFESGSNFIAKFSLTMSAEFSYNNHSSFTETYEESETIEITAAAKTSTVMWQAQSEFILRRADGTEVSRWSRDEGPLYYRELAIDGSRSTLKQWDSKAKQWNTLGIDEKEPA